MINREKIKLLNEIEYLKKLLNHKNKEIESLINEIIKLSPNFRKN